jgi:2-polyprenyl-3-methyl-5-hydroxy-6-metoxy-1,4-benzoquinol methylase
LNLRKFWTETMGAVTNTQTFHIPLFSILQPMSTIHYTSCPVCHSTGIHPLLTVKDYMVSKENFVIWQCENCSLRFTQDVPDADSIGPYYKSEDYISHTDTAKGLVNKLYQEVRSFTLKQKASLIRQQTGLHAGNILDVGSGTGAFLNTMKKQSWNVRGIEPDAGARKIAKDHYGIDLLDSPTLFDLQPSSFDAITLWHVLEHVHDLHPYIEQLKMLLKPTGKIFIAVPNYDSRDADAYRLKWAAYDVPRHLYHFTPKAMEALMKQHGLIIATKKPMWFDSFYISMLSSKYKNGKTNWIGAIVTGIQSNLKAVANTDKCSSVIYVVNR